MVTKEKKQQEEQQQQRIKIKLKAYDNKIIDKSAKQIVETIERNGGTVIGPVPLPTEIRKYTVNRSTFINKDSREQFEMRVHKRLVEIPDYTPKIIDSLQNLNLPAGVDIELKM
ncbi:MAG: 30S ribosomal protein S10 [Candidatus Yanofskybacteria bacterium CG10_big_fil_rev_8_21_14_0_10_36_16]|uniref:Small ribosomal subunit protein uS10 n=1 Tax=Candidatus Yanofskybacteria bacterium CG10_big_fil_rev_8_21_14_0_10_36_16 TaxID=1975096 RepID=A0A2J0Q873_9BACT|nr:MAG: 30S ribosomal protein S10 [Candidatus Yanofskybacteria bacterium CG10_big_fil_rev_8_21_14_0_10_36_16]